MSVAAAAPIVDVAASARTHPEASYTWTTLQQTACKRKVSFESSFDLQSCLILVSALMRAARTGRPYERCTLLCISIAAYLHTTTRHAQDI